MPTGRFGSRLFQADESLYRRLIDLAPDAMIGVDESGRIVLVNSQAETLFGYSRDELIGHSVEPSLSSHTTFCAGRGDIL